MHRWLKSIFAVGRPLAAMLCVIGFFTLLDFVLHGSEATFWSKQNLQSISVQNAFVAICSIGMLLVIISGGIDLSAGVALALSSTILAWGIREDVGFILSHGENVAGAVARLKTAENSLHDAKARNQPDQLEQANTEIDVRRRRLIELLQVKRSQLDSVAQARRIARFVDRRKTGRRDEGDFRLAKSEQLDRCRPGLAPVAAECR